jgi:hypothetical protein
MTATTVSSPGIFMYQMHFHRVFLAMHGVFAWRMEMELLERPGLLIESDMSGVRLFTA